MIRFLITFTMLLLTISVTASTTDDGKDKWPNSKTKREFKRNNQPYLTKNGLDYKKLRKAHKNVKHNECRGAY